MTPCCSSGLKAWQVVVHHRQLPKDHPDEPAQECPHHAVWSSPDGPAGPASWVGPPARRPTAGRRQRAYGPQVVRAPPPRRRGGPARPLVSAAQHVAADRCLQALIVRLRQCRMTADEIASRLQLARSSVAAELVRLRLNRLSALAPKAPVRRYDRARPRRSDPPRRQKARPLRQARQKKPGAARTTASAGSSSPSASTTMPGLPSWRSSMTRPVTPAPASSRGRWSGSPATASAYAAS